MHTIALSVCSPLRYSTVFELKRANRKKKLRSLYTLPEAISYIHILETWSDRGQFTRSFWALWSSIHCSNSFPCFFFNIVRAWYDLSTYSTMRPCFQGCCSWKLRFGFLCWMPYYVTNYRSCPSGYVVTHGKFLRICWVLGSMVNGNIRRYLSNLSSIALRFRPYNLDRPLMWSIEVKLSEEFLDIPTSNKTDLPPQTCAFFIFPQLIE